MQRSKMLSNRLLALALVGAFIGLLRWLAPAPVERAVWLYLVALPLGYGHLIGAAVFSCARGRRSQRAAGSRWLTSAFAGSCVLSLLAIYTWTLQIDVLQPWVLIPMLLLSAWHIAENDLALGCAYRNALRLGAVAHTLRHHGIALVLTAGVSRGTATPEGAASRAWLGGWIRPWRPWLMLDELFRGAPLSRSFVAIFFEARVCIAAARAIDAARLRRRVFALHAVPLALNAAFYLWLPAIHFYAAAPALYLFWSVLRYPDRRRAARARTAAA
jgi:hypothetical protein